MSPKHDAFLGFAIQSNERLSESEFHLKSVSTVRQILRTALQMASIGHKKYQCFHITQSLPCSSAELQFCFSERKVRLLITCSCKEMLLQETQKRDPSPHCSLFLAVMQDHCAGTPMERALLLHCLQSCTNPVLPRSLTLQLPEPVMRPM